MIRAFGVARPDVTINCIGLIKQQKRAKEALPSIDLNARFPHQVAALCAATGSRLIHISTDCVFAGTEGPVHRERSGGCAGRLRARQGAGRGGP